MLDVPSERPPDFDLVAYWKSSTEKIRESLSRYSITLRHDPWAAEQLQKWHLAKPVPSDVPDLEGWVTLRAEFDD